MAKQSNKRRDLKIIWHSNAPNTGSGYAVYTRDLLFRLLEDGWNVANIGFYGQEGYFAHHHGDDLVKGRFEGLKLKTYPKMNDPYGSDALIEHSTDFGAHVAFTMIDLHVMNTQALQELNKRGIRFIPYLPIDQDPPTTGVLTNLNNAYKIVTFSKYGQKTLQDHGYTSTLILEGIDTNIFKPADKVKAREELQLPQDKFLFGMIGANKENPPRKGYQEAIEAFNIFLKKHPNSAMFFHTQQMSPTGFPIMEYGKYLGIHDKMYFLNPYKGTFKADSYWVAKELNAFDILLHPSQTEGFGLLPIEAMSCGVPPIVNRSHSQPEMIVEGVTGEVCEAGKPWFRGLGAYVYPANVDSLYEKMETLYAKVSNGKTKKKMARAARQHVLDNFNIDKQVKQLWVPFLEDLQSEILGKV